MMREPAQIFVNQRGEFGESCAISLAPIAQELPNSLWRGGSHLSGLSPIAVELAISSCSPGVCRKGVVSPPFRKFLPPNDQVARGFLFVVVKGELTPIKNNQKKEQKMKNMNKKSILGAFPSVFGLMALLTCAVLATSANAGSPSPQNPGGPLVGFFDSTVTLTNCNGVVIKSFEAYEMFHQGGTLTSTDNQPPSSRGPGFGTWQTLGGRSYSAPFEFFSFNADGTFAGEVKINRVIQLGADGNTYTSEGSVEIVDPNGNVIATFCVSEVAARVIQ